MARRPKKSEEKVSVEVDEQEDVQESAETTEELEGTETLDEDGLDDTQVQCGEALYIARTNEGLSTQEVAKQLRLGNAQIEALERDDFASLPEATIVKGFIRNYAKLLKIPAEPLLNAYIQLAPEKEGYNFALNPGINMKITESRKSRKLNYFFAFAALLLAAGIWFFYQSYVQKPNPINPMPESTELLPELELPISEQVEDTPTTTLVMPEQPKEPPVEAAETAVAAKVEAGDAEPEAVVTPEKAQDSEELEEAEQSEEAVTTEPPTVVGKTRLQFSATQETWLSVVNVSGREVYNKILYAGDRDTIDISQPSEIVVGNAHGTTLIVDGKSIDLAPYTRINVARYRFN